MLKAMQQNLHCFLKGHFWMGISGGLKKLMNFALEVQKKKKLMPSLWGGDGGKEAMKENLHCVESHEAEAALFFGGLQSGGLQGPGRMEKKKL